MVLQGQVIAESCYTTYVFSRLEETIMAKCDMCDKGPVFGRNIRHRHSGQWLRRAPKTSRMFHPNIQNATIYVNGVAKKVKICTRCLRSQYKTA